MSLIFAVLFSIIPSTPTYAAPAPFYNSDCGFSSTLLSNWQTLKNNNPNDTMILAKWSNGRTRIWQRPSGLFMNYVGGNSRIDMTGSTLNYDFTGDTISNPSYSWSNYYLNESEVVCVQDLQIGSQDTPSSFYHALWYEPAQYSLQPILNTEYNYTPPITYYPNRPVISYKIQGKTLELTCELSTFFAPNDSSFTNCQFFIDKDSGDTDNLNLTQFTGADATSTVSNMLNLNESSDNHIAYGTRCFDKDICPTPEQAVFKYTFDEFGKYYVKLAIQNDTPDEYISAVDRVIVIDGTSFNGDSENGTIVPDIYETCPNWTDPAGFLSCTFKNFGTFLITSISNFFSYLFTPTISIESLWADFMDTFTLKLGFLSYPFTFIPNLATTASAATTADCTLSFGTILDGQPVEYDFCQFEDNLPTFFQFFQTILIAGTSLLLIAGLYSKFKEITAT